MCSVPYLNFVWLIKKAVRVDSNSQKRIVKDINAVIAVIEHKGKYFIQKRPSKGLLADLWEFPGGKIEAD